jgi:hypothetical protein
MMMMMMMMKVMDDTGLGCWESLFCNFKKKMITLLDITLCSAVDRN